MTDRPQAPPDSPGVDEDEFLAGVTAALQHRGEPITIGDYEAARVVPAGPGVVDRFVEMAAAAGMKIVRPTDANQAADCILEILRGRGYRVGRVR